MNPSLLLPGEELTMSWVSPSLLTSPYPLWFLIIAAGVLGLIWGSFFNVCIARLPDRKSFLTRSQCPKCQTLIPWFANIPVLSWIVLQAKCLKCKKPISIQYPLVEISTGLLFAVTLARYGISWQWASYTIFASALLIVSVIDLHLQIIPDEISLPGMGVGICFALITGDIPWWDSVLGAVLGGGIFLTVALLYEKLTGREGLGGGDVKLLAMIGAWLGYQAILPTIVVSSALGSVVGIALMAFQGKNFKSAIPFGPFLAVGALIYLFCGKMIVHMLQEGLFPPTY